MSTITTRSGKGSPLTNTELDTNFTNLNTDKLEKSGGTMTGNLDFSGTALRIRGDFTSNSPSISNRLMFQTSNANSNTLFSILPSGTSTTSRFVAFNNSDPTNSNALELSAISTDVRVQSFANGTGASVPLSLVMQGTIVAQISTGNNFLIGSTTDDGANKLQVTGSAKFTGDSTFSSTGALGVSLGTTAQRPASPSKGMIRYNSTTEAFEGYSGSSPSWQSIGTGGGSGSTAVDGGAPDSTYSQITAIDGGTP